ncbi:hypothetical protein BH10BAC2_BH10BAC2_45670 [soil metagenome]
MTQGLNLKVEDSIYKNKPKFLAGCLLLNNV